MGKQTATGLRASVDVERPVLLVGSTRSGTTLLSLMVRNHPAMSFTGELEWIWDFPFEIDPSLDQAPPQAYLDWLPVQRHFQHHHLRLDPALDFGALVRDFLHQMRVDDDPSGAKPRVGGTLHRHLRQALRIWPQARLVHLVRDGRDVCASWLRLGWLGSGYDAALHWMDELAEWRKVRDALPPEQWMEIRFENLVTDPVRELGRLCAFAGENYDHGMLSYPDSSTYGPVDPRQVGKWPSELGIHDLRIFEALAGEELVRHGYGLSGESPFPMLSAIEPLLSVEAKVRRHRAAAREVGSRLHLADVVARRVGPRWFRERVQSELNAIETAKLK